MKLRRKLAWRVKAILALALVGGVVVLGSVLGRADVTAREPGFPLPTPTSTPVPPEPVVTVSPGTALPNEAIIITGTRFTTGGGATITKITIGGEEVPSAKMNDGAAIQVDGAGNFGTTVIIPVSTTTLITGRHTVTAVDSSGRTGRTTLTIQQRVLKVNPETSRRNSSIMVTGTGFPVSSTRPAAEPNPSVRITYEITGRTPKTIATTLTNGSGEFAVSFLVPVDALIPSSNTVRALIVGFVERDETKPHSIPDRSVKLSPDSGSPGTAITVTGINFPAFTPVSSLTIGRIQVLPSPGPFTNAEGSFTASVVVPAIEVGIQAVSVEVGDSTALISFRVTASPATPVPPKPTGAAAQLAPVGANLVRVWGFNATTQKFQLYDPAAPTLSDLTSLVQGRGYWILVTRDQTVTLSSGSYSLSVGWNLIGWLG